MSKIYVHSFNSTSFKCVIPQSKFLWNAEKINLTNIIKQISKLTCRNYIVPIRIEKITNITIMLQEPISISDAESIFINILKTHGLTRIKNKKNSYYKIINKNDASLRAFSDISFFNNFNKNLLNKSITLQYMSTIIYSPKNINIDVAYNLIKVFISKSGNVNYLDKKYIIIKDKQLQIKLMLKALKKINKREHKHLLHFQTKHIYSKTMQKIINKLHVLGFFNNYIYYRDTISTFDIHKNHIKDQYQLSKKISKIVLFSYQNTCFIKGNARFLKKIQMLIDYIDTSLIPIKTNIIKVFNIYNNDAKDVIKILYDIFINNNNFKNYRYLCTSICEKNNSIIIFGSKKSLGVVSKLIRKIQSQKKQIHIEASILDISITSSNERQWDFVNIFNYKDNNNTHENLSFFFANSNGQKLIKSNHDTSLNKKKEHGNSNKSNKNFMQSLVGNFGLNIPKIKITNNLFLNDFTSLFKSHETYSDIKIIASPSLTTMNHKKAEISVGEKIPTISSLSNQTPGRDSNSLSIPHVKYEDISLRFIATPHIKDQNIIYIDIEQENNEIGENIPLYNNFTQRSIKTKRIKTSICTINKQTIVIGGLINEKTIKTKKNIPILSDMPFIKFFFEDQNNVKRKSNLVLLITPTIIDAKNSLTKKYKINKTKKFIN